MSESVRPRRTLEQFEGSAPGALAQNVTEEYENQWSCVTDIKPDERRLMLKSEDGSQETSIVLNKQNSMTKKLGVFTEDRQEFYAGDRVKFKITDSDVGIFNSHEGEIIRFQSGVAVVEDNKFERVLVPLESLAAKALFCRDPLGACDVPRCTTCRNAQAGSAPFDHRFG